MLENSNCAEAFILQLKTFDTRDDMLIKRKNKGTLLFYLVTTSKVLVDATSKAREIAWAIYTYNRTIQFYIFSPPSRLWNFSYREVKEQAAT